MEVVTFLPTQTEIKTKQTSFVAINKKYNIQYEKYEINPQKRNTIVTKSGAIITIPPDSLIDSSGLLLTDRCSIYYREIRKAGDIISNGINMEFNENGKKYVLETSGMFEIRSFKDKNPIKIRDGKQLKVEYVSNSQEVYQNYYFDEKTNEWKLSDKQEQSKNSTLLPLINPTKKSSTDYIIKAKIDVSEIPQINDYNNIEWAYRGTENISLLEQRLKQNLPKQEITIQDISKMLLKYTLYSPVNTKDKIELLLQPVFAEKNYEDALNAYKIRLKKIEEVKQKRKSLLSANNVLNNFTITQFGYQNCDVVYRYPGHIFVNANFNFGQRDRDLNKQNMQIFLITNKDKVTMEFRNDFTMFNFNPNARNKIIGILPGQAIGVMRSDDFSKMKITPNSNITFNLIEINQSIENLEKFNSLIDTL